MDEIKRSGTSILKNDYINAWGEAQLLFMTALELSKNGDVAMERVRSLLSQKKIQNFWERYPGQQREFYRPEILEIIGQVNHNVDLANYGYSDMDAQEFSRLFLKVAKLVCTPEKFHEIEMEFQDHGMDISLGR